MKLTPEQIAQYDRDGFLFVPQLFSREEMQLLYDQLPPIFAARRREAVFEKDGKTPRSCFNMHTYNEPYARLVRHPRTLGPVKQILDDEVYVFQIVVNFKAPFAGDQWPWHQDYPTYHFDDGMPAPRAVNVLVFLEDVNYFNGPLMLVPGSHKSVFPLPEVDTQKTSYPARWLGDQHVGPLARANGIVAPTGPAGSVVFAHTNIVHGSGPNMSPWGRTMVSLTLNSLENKITESKRPGFVVLRDFTPLKPLEDHCLRAA